jgi:hypothetical protein
VSEVAMNDRPWRGAMLFGPRAFGYLGAIGPTDLHAHHAVQVAIGSPIRSSCATRRAAASPATPSTSRPT